MHKLEQTDPSLSQELLNGDFSVSTSHEVPFNYIGVDNNNDNNNNYILL